VGNAVAAGISNVYHPRDQRNTRFLRSAVKKKIDFP